jgi:hypothetical protein
MNITASSTLKYMAERYRLLFTFHVHLQGNCDKWNCSLVQFFIMRERKERDRLKSKKKKN